MSRQETLQSVDRALVLLRRLAEGEATSTELARKTGINRTVVHRLLATLGRHGFVRRHDKGYALGTTLVELAGRIERDVRGRARPILEHLSREFGETAVLAIRDGDDAVCIDQAEGLPHIVRVHYQPGLRHPLAVAAHGHAILGFLPRDESERISAAASDGGGLRRRLDEVRQRGWAVSHDELQQGAVGLAVPLVDADGWAVASVGVVAPAQRFPAPDVVATATLAAVRDLDPAGSRHAGVPSPRGTEANARRAARRDGRAGVSS